MANGDGRSQILHDNMMSCNRTLVSLSHFLKLGRLNFSWRGCRCQAPCFKDWKCPLCNGPLCNAQHMLNCCPTALTDGRYTWRHDMVLTALLSFLQKFNPEASVYADLPDHRACASPPATIPPTIIGTTTQPDLVLVYGKHATMLELTVPWNNLTSIKNARAWKQGKVNYQLLASDLSAQGYQVQLLTIEISCLGHYTHEAYTALRLAAPPEQSL